MADSFSLIVAKTTDGGSLNLYTEIQCAAAIADGTVTRDSNIVVYVDGNATSMRAADHPAFAASTPLPPPAPSLPSPSHTPIAAAPQVPPQSEYDIETPLFDDRDLRAPAPARTPPVAPAAPYVAPVPPYRPSNGPAAVAFIRNLLLGIAGLSLLGYCASKNGGAPTVISNPAPPADTSPATDNMTSTNVDPTANLPVVRRFAVRPVNIQMAATNDLVQKDLPQLERGAELSGVIVPGSKDPAQAWLKLRSGQYEGRYVWAGNLGDAAPPSLDTSFNGAKMTFVAGTIRVAPEDDAATITDPDFPGGRTFAVAGKVNGTWAELLLKQGGVGYVQASVFDPPSTSAEGNRHEIFVDNQCSTKSYSIAIYYQDTNGWQTNEGAIWDIAPSQSGYPLTNNARISTTSAIMYYAITEIDNKSARFSGSKSVQYGNTLLEMQQIFPGYMDNGDYKITLTC